MAEMMPRPTTKEVATLNPSVDAVGCRVAKVGGDYRFDGVVVAQFAKLSGVIRYAVEDDRGILHIYGPKNLRAKEEGEA